jgi:hypothetical protein
MKPMQFAKLLAVQPAELVRARLAAWLTPEESQISMVQSCLRTHYAEFKVSNFRTQYYTLKIITSAKKKKNV